MWYSNTIPIIIFSIVGVIALVAIYYRMLSILFTLIASGIIAIWAGSYLGSTAGIIIFCVIFFPALKVAFIVDAAFGLYDNHHSRNDVRAMRSAESQKFIAEYQEELRHQNARKEAIYNHTLDEYMKEYYEKKSSELNS